ncbi:MAG: hypothetical protein ACOY46_02940 [Bacillota bacterium]
MPEKTAVTIGLLILIIYATQRFIHRKVLRMVVTGFIIFGIIGAVTHPGDVIGWLTRTAHRFWPIIMSGTERGTDGFFSFLHGISGAVKK